MKEEIKKAIAMAKRICKDPRHGYDNRPGHRLGPDYACSSFVAKCYSHTGVPLNSYTQTMKAQWKPYGFKDVASKVDFKTGAGMKPGDVVVTPGKHTEMVINSNHRLAGARGNPKGGPQNGKPGDQTGHEISIRNYYDDGWTVCLRYCEKCNIITLS